MAMPSNTAPAVHPSRAPSQARPFPSGTAVLSRPVAPSLTVDITTQRPDSARLVSQAQIPAIPAVIAAFSAFARGSVLRTETGETAVEDLLPGDRLWSAGGTPVRVKWIGSTVFETRSAQNPTRLFRVMPDTFGPSRPARFVTLGPGARILQSTAALREKNGGHPLLTSIREFVDGESVIEIAPPTPQQLFHVVTDRHAVISAGGLEVESFHPGTDALRSLPTATRERFLGLFPHLNTLADFGPLARTRAPDLRIV